MFIGGGGGGGGIGAEKAGGTFLWDVCESQHLTHLRGCHLGTKGNEFGVIFARAEVAQSRATTRASEIRR